MGKCPQAKISDESFLHLIYLSDGSKDIEQSECLLFLWCSSKPTTQETCV